MTAKQWLSRARVCDKEIKVLLKALARERDLILSMTAQLETDVVSHTPDPHKYDSYVILVDNINEKIDTLYGIKAEVEAAISKVEPQKLRSVLMLRYVSIMTWEEIAVSMDISYRHVCRLHGEALEEIKKILPMS